MAQLKHGACGTVWNRREYTAFSQKEALLPLLPLVVLKERMRVHFQNIIRGAPGLAPFSKAPCLIKSPLQWDM